MAIKSFFSAVLVLICTTVFAQNRAYVTTSSAGVQVINIDDGEIVQTLGINGTRLSVDEERNLVAISSTTGEIIFVDYISNGTVGTTSLGVVPTGSAFSDVFGGQLLALDSTPRLNYISPFSFTSFDIPLAATPQDIVLQKNTLPTELAYITLGNDTVSVWNVESLFEVTAIPVGTDPGELAILPNELEVYVANRGSGNVSVIDTTTWTVTHTITVGATPLSISSGADDSTVYVGTDSVGVLLIDTTSKTIIGTISNTGANNGIDITADRQSVAIASEMIEAPFSAAGLGIVPVSSTTTQSAISFAGPQSVVTFDFPFVRIPLRGESGIEKTLTQSNLYNQLTWSVPDIEFNEILILKDGQEVQRLTRLDRSYTDGNLTPGTTHTYTVQLLFDGSAVGESEVTLTTASSGFETSTVMTGPSN